jgi:hypothetical protein
MYGIRLGCLLAALLLQRFAPQVKAALSDDPPEAIA